MKVLVKSHLRPLLRASESSKSRAHIQRDMKPLLKTIEPGVIDPSFVITNRVALKDALDAYKTFIKVALQP